MSAVKTEDEITVVEREMKEFWTELKSVYGTEQINQTLALRDSCKESIQVLSGKNACVHGVSCSPRYCQSSSGNCSLFPTERWAKKLKEGDLMIDKIQEYRNGTVWCFTYCLTFLKLSTAR